tara:strand:+ start:63 stop:335 length:273 start_codon:yes stop_codon:yes gene_type:complete
MKTINDLIERLTSHANRNRTAPALRTFEAVEGRKYTKIIGSDGAVHCFIDDDSNIYKPAGWAKPAKGIRANLKTLDLTKVDSHGGWLYAR